MSPPKLKTDLPSQAHVATHRARAAHSGNIPAKKTVRDEKRAGSPPLHTRTRRRRGPRRKAPRCGTPRKRTEPSAEYAKTYWIPDTTGTGRHAAAEDPTSTEGQETPEAAEKRRTSPLRARPRNERTKERKKSRKHVEQPGALAGPPRRMPRARIPSCPQRHQHATKARHRRTSATRRRRRYGSAARRSVLSSRHAQQ